MKTIFAVIGFVVVALIVGTCVACNDDDDDRDTFGRIQLVNHERDRCYDYDCGDEGGYDDGYGRGGDGGESGGHQGYGGGGGRSGDQGDGDGQCRNFCNNTFPIVPTPGDRGGEQR